MIKFDQVGKLYPGGYEALKKVSFEIEKGELVFITGHSGAGKSTLLKLVAGIERPTSGTVLIGNQNIAKLRRSAIPHLRRRFGLVFQDHKLLYDRNVLENVILPLDIAGLPRAEGMKRARAALDKVKLLGLEKANPISLSGGEQQRLCVARAIVNRPSIVLADEPTGNLDAEYAGEIMEMFKSFNQVGVTLLIATHDESLITRYSSRVLHLKQGELLI